MPIWPLKGALGQGGGLGLAVPDKQKALAQILDPVCLCGCQANSSKSSTKCAQPGPLQVPTYTSTETNLCQGSSGQISFQIPQKFFSIQTIF